MSSLVKDVLILGGGLAGLSAALRLTQAGLPCMLLEKRPFLGGRAYSFTEAKTQSLVDNGQHLMMGAYHAMRRFLTDLGQWDQIEVQPGLEVNFASPGSAGAQLQCPRLPAPWHLALGIWRFKALKLRDKWHMRHLMSFCHKPTLGPEALDRMSVAELLAQTAQTPAAIEKLWEPITLATLNEPIARANARFFVEVLRRTLLASPADAQLWVPKVGLSQLYAEAAQNYLQKRGVHIHFQRQALRIEREGSGFRVHTSEAQSYWASRLVIAIPPDAFHKLLSASSEELVPLASMGMKFNAAPIVSVNLWYKNFNPGHHFLGLLQSPWHWLFDKSKIFNPASPYVSLVMSAAYDWSARSKEELVTLAHQELGRFYPELKAQLPYHSQIVKELAATYGGHFEALTRPGAHSGVPGMYLAGDWTDTGLPATMESAVLSGEMAARAIVEEGLA